MQAGAAVRGTVDGDEQAPGAPAPGGDVVRAHTYSLLGALLCAPPSAQLLALLNDIEVASGEGSASPRFAESWRVLRMAAERASVAQLDDEYHALFIGLGRGELVPYGSWYLTGFLMDRPLASLRADLARLGIERRSEVREPEDHAGALCETMAMLVAGDTDLDAQRRFYQTHMEPWLATFFRDLRDAKSAVFYRAVGRFACEFMDFESRYMTMMV